jgi:hypothetical protein
MTPTPAAALLQKLPKDAADFVVRGAKAKDGDRDELYRKALAAVAFPEDRTLTARVEDLTPAQRAIAELVVDEAGLSPYALPRGVGARRRWLGLDAAGPLEIEVANGKEKEPLWRALQRDEGDAALAALALPQRLAAIETVYYEEWDYGIDGADGIILSSLSLAQIKKGDAKTLAWARAAADRLLARERAKKSEGARYKLPVQTLCWPVFVALARSGEAIEPRWDALLPLGSAKGAAMKECVSALPEARRVPAVLAALDRTATTLDAMNAGLALYPSLPSPALAEKLAAIADRDGYRNAKKELAALVKKHGGAASAKTKTKAKTTDAKMQLTCVSLSRPKRASELSALSKDQLRIGGKAWDGKNVSADMRLSDDDGSETSLAGTVEIRAIADGKGTIRYDALTYAGDSGIVFAAGTTKKIAQIVQGSLEHDDEALRDALADAIVMKPARGSVKKKTAKAKKRKQT